MLVNCQGVSIPIATTGADAATTAGSPQEQEDDNNTQLYEQQQHQPIGIHGHGPLTTASHSSAAPSKQPHSTPFYPRF